MTTHYLVLSALLFSIGAIGVLVRRNAIVIFMCVELMLTAVNISLVAFGWESNTLNGQAFAIFAISIAAAEAVVGLGIILALSRRGKSVDVEDIQTLKD